MNHDKNRDKCVLSLNNCSPFPDPTSYKPIHLLLLSSTSLQNNAELNKHGKFNTCQPRQPHPKSLARSSLYYVSAFKLVDSISQLPPRPHNQLSRMLNRGVTFWSPKERVIYGINELLFRSSN